LKEVKGGEVKKEIATKLYNVANNNNIKNTIVTINFGSHHKSEVGVQENNISKLILFFLLHASTNILYFILTYPYTVAKG
jgi:hypothetical protein